MVNTQQWKLWPQRDDFNNEGERGLRRKKKKKAKPQQQPNKTRYLTTQLKVAHDNGYLSTRENQNNENDWQKAKDVIKLVQPNGRQDEEQFDKDSSKSIWVVTTRAGWFDRLTEECLLSKRTPLASCTTLVQGFVVESDWSSPEDLPPAAFVRYY